MTYVYFLNIIKSSVFPYIIIEEITLKNENNCKYFMISISIKGRCIYNEDDISAKEKEESKSSWF